MKKINLVIIASFIFVIALFSFIYFNREITGKVVDTTPTCIDTDVDTSAPDGKNYAKVGTAISTRYINEKPLTIYSSDYCSNFDGTGITQNATYLFEWYCEAGAGKGFKYKCPVYCCDRKCVDSLSDPACGGTIVPPPCSSSWSCGEWGTCANSIKNRTCTDTNNCTNPKTKLETLPCTDAKQSSNIPILIKNCTDTDKGKNYNLWGNATNQTDAWEDTCYGDDVTLVETYCNANNKTVEYELKNCSEVNPDYWCNEGVCEEIDTSLFDSSLETFYFNLTICKGDICNETARLVSIGENISINYTADMNDLEILGMVTYPDQNTSDLVLPAEITAEQVGLYIIDVLASKDGYEQVWTEEIIEVTDGSEGEYYEFGNEEDYDYSGDEGNYEDLGDEVNLEDENIIDEENTDNDSENMILISIIIILVLIIIGGGVAYYLMLQKNSPYREETIKEKITKENNDIKFEGLD